eukprot:6163131-Prorocentrum_lima.AAC.1
MGAKERGDGLLINPFALLPVPLGDEKMLDMSQDDVVDRSEFRSTPLWISYCEHAFSGTLKSART